MKQNRETLAFSVALAALLLAVQLVQAAEGDVLALTHANVIDGTGSPVQTDVTVIVTGNRISAVGKSAKIHLPTTAVIVDATGKFLIPGLWDMHVHWYDKDYLPLFLANGVTGIRLMLGAPMHHEWRKDIETGKLQGPRLFIASPIVDGPKPVWPGSISVGNEAEGRQAVIKVKQEGADFLKVYSLLPRAGYFAIAEEAKKQGISFAGHVPIAVSAAEAASSGQKSIEHLSQILTSCSTKEAHILQAEQAIFDGLLATNDPIGALTQVRRQGKLALETYSQEKANELFSLLKSKHTWQCPTMVVLRNIRHLDDASITNDTRLKYMPRMITASWDPYADLRFVKSRTPDDVALGKRVYQKERQIVGAMQRAGVDILAGTDTLNPYCFPGFSLHDELALLVQAGLTPMQALQAATRNAARFMGREAELGTIEPGKLADMVLLDRNPLKDIGNTRIISALVFNGRLFPKSELVEMLKKIETLATQSKMPIALVLFKTIEQQDLSAAVAQYRKLKAAEAVEYDFSEEELNSLGYELLGMKKTKEAIQILRLNAEAYPQSANVYDSLGEAYLDAGDKENAALNYEKSLQINPNNANGAAKFKQLRPKVSAQAPDIASDGSDGNEKAKQRRIQRWARPVNSIRLVLPASANERTENLAQVFVRQVTQRCDAKVALTGDAQLQVSLLIEPGLGIENFKITGETNGIAIFGGDARGLIYGVGKFLHTSRYDQGGFTPSAWRGNSGPQGSYRALVATAHFMNFYEAAPIEEIRTYIEDLSLWGANSVSVGFPTWDFKGLGDPAARRNLEHSRSVAKAAKAIGLMVGLGVCPNQGFADAPTDIRARDFPDGLGRRGFFGVNCCPSKPAGHEYLLKLYGRLFDEFKDVGLDYVGCWPYDEGGCGCADCWPWGARGFPNLSRDVVLAARARFPDVKAVLSTWCYDTPPAGEWEGLAKFLEKDKNWLDYILADSHGEFPRYPLDKGVPGGLPLLNFPEISMFGRTPWGGYGANPLPARLEALWKQTEGKLAGGGPYSEGIYADINEVICLQFYWQKSRTAEDIVREYLAFEYSPDVVDDLWEAVRLLEATWLQRGPDSEKAFALIQKAEAKLTPQAKAAWRWRILYLRGLIDSELFRRNEKMEGSVLKNAFDELTKLYHAENVHGMPVRPPLIPATDQ